MTPRSAPLQTCLALALAHFLAFRISFWMAAAAAWAAAFVVAPLWRHEGQRIARVSKRVYAAGQVRVAAAAWRTSHASQHLLRGGSLSDV